mmetsp:Transcript_51704/g.135834  ORF Transcript_51704/g.135834 Transcript_51704/m.135834 type:complete len:306 (-) Transcript_51704:441-1358(-)
MIFCARGCCCSGRGCSCGDRTCRCFVPTLSPARSGFECSQRRGANPSTSEGSGCLLFSTTSLLSPPTAIPFFGCSSSIAKTSAPRSSPDSRPLPTFFASVRCSSAEPAMLLNDVVLLTSSIAAVASPQRLRPMLAVDETWPIIFVSDGPPSTVRSSWRNLWIDMLRCLRRSTTSLTVARLDPRKVNTKATKSPNVSFFSLAFPMSSSSSPAKMKSMLSTNPIGSTPASSNALHASIDSRIIENCSLSISPCSMSPAISSQTFSNCALVKATRIVSFSVAATALTTSQSTPINMFMTVRQANKINK